MNRFNYYKFINYEIALEDNVINFSDSISKFITSVRSDYEWDLEFAKTDRRIKPTKYISVVIQVQDTTGRRFTIGNRYPLDILNNEEISAYIAYLTSKSNFLDIKYESPTYETLFINYVKVFENDYKEGVRRIKGNNPRMDIPLQEEIPQVLPVNFDYFNWGLVKRTGEAKHHISSIDHPKLVGHYVILTQYDKYNSIIEIFDEVYNHCLLKISDKVISFETNEFIRKIGNKHYHIKEGQLYFIFEDIFPTKFITKANKSKSKPEPIMTLDLETYSDQNKVMHVYCASFFDGKETFNFYLSDYESPELMFMRLFKKVFSRKNRNAMIYIHNMKDFDVIFIMKHLAKLDYISIDSTVKDGKILNLKIIYGANGGNHVIFRDSKLLLDASLANLTKPFNSTDFKDIFPHKFVREDNLNYIGPVPTYEYFDTKKVSLDDYNKYCGRFNNNWNLKDEAIKYCNLDCTSLAEVINNFSDYIFETYQVNIDKCPTLPSLAFRIFRTKFLNIKIPVITDKLYDQIVEAYYGGHVDMYIPFNKDGEKLYIYDVNSLYPHQMVSRELPHNIKGYFKGDMFSMPEYVELFNKNSGFYKVKINAPEDIMLPILPYKLNSSTIFPVGTWEGWYFKEELDNASKLGYSFEYLEGYIFDKKEIFKELIDSLY